MRTKPSLIALTGHAGVGKDFVFQTAETLPLATLPLFKVERFAFADAVKEEVAADWGVTVAEVNANKPFFREKLQNLGQSMRERDPLFWINLLHDNLLESLADLVFITDLRYENEAEWVRSLGGVVVKVERPGVGPLNGHASEVELLQIDPDYTLRNTGDERIIPTVERLLEDLGWLP